VFLLATPLFHFSPPLSFPHRATCSFFLFSNQERATFLLPFSGFGTPSLPGPFFTFFLQPTSFQKPSLLPFRPLTSRFTPSFLPCHRNCDTSRDEPSPSLVFPSMFQPLHFFPSPYPISFPFFRSDFFLGKLWGNPDPPHLSLSPSFPFSPSLRPPTGFPVVSLAFCHTEKGWVFPGCCRVSRGGHFINQSGRGYLFSCP